MLEIRLAQANLTITRQECQLLAQQMEYLQLQYRMCEDSQSVAKARCADLEKALRDLEDAAAAVTQQEPAQPTERGPGEK